LENNLHQHTILAYLIGTTTPGWWDQPAARLPDHPVYLRDDPAPSTSLAKSLYVPYAGKQIVLFLE
jgi:hypothetical protein